MEQLLDVIPHLQDITDFKMPHDIDGDFEIPVMMLRFTQNTFSAKACFSSWTLAEDRRSMYETLDELIRGQTLPSDLPVLAVEYDEDRWWSVDNRRLLVLKWFQACRQNETVWATCKMNTSKERFQNHLDTTNEGLSIFPRVSYQESFHLGGPVFNPAKQGMHAIKRFYEKHSSMDKSFLHMVKLVASKRRRDADTITMASSSALPRKRLRSTPEPEMPPSSGTKQWWVSLDFQWGQTADAVRVEGSCLIGEKSSNDPFGSILIVEASLVLL